MQSCYFSNVLQSRYQDPGNLGLVQRRATNGCAHQREILSEGTVYIILVLNDKVYAQIMIGE